MGMVVVEAERPSSRTQDAACLVRVQGLRSQTAQVGVLASPFTSSVTWDSRATISLPHFPHLSNGDTKVPTYGC